MRYLDFESEFESRFPLQEVKVSEKSETFLFYVSCPKESVSYANTIRAWKLLHRRIASPLITHRYKLADIEAAYHLFENKSDGVIKVAVEP